MAIEFSCPSCRKLLKTSEDKAGRTAKCPQCGETISVPAQSSTAIVPHATSDEDVITYHLQEPRTSRPAESSASREHEGTQPCPFCGERIELSATKCRFCGELLAGSQPGSSPEPSTKIAVSAVFAETWDLYKAQMGLCLGAFLLAAFLTFLAGLPANIIQNLIKKGAVGQNAMGVAVLLFLGASLFSTIVNLYLSAGFNILLLKLIREQPAQVSDIFSAGRFLPRLVGNSLAFLAAVAFGTLLLVVPGVIVFLVYWPFGLVLVDSDPARLQSLSIARRITAGNRLASLVLFLAAGAINVLGVAACCVGVVFSASFTALMFAVAYDQMVCRETVVA